MSSFMFGFEIDGDDQDENGSSDSGTQKPSDAPKTFSSADGENRKLKVEDGKKQVVNPIKVPVKDPILFQEHFIDDSPLPPNARFNELMLPTEETVCHFQRDGMGYVDLNGKPSDLIPGVYEGGAKTWECSVYLVELLAELYKSVDRELKNLSVLELGCGSALPGLFCLMRGANVDLQDYNKEVIVDVTIPNFKLNSQSQENMGTARFYSGDWTDLHLQLCRTKRYDMILTAETIYSASNYPKLSRIFHSLLKPDGIIYLAAKNHYFGVGGGIELFSQFLNMENCWSIELVKSIDTNVKCSILKITRGRHEVLT